MNGDEIRGAWFLDAGGSWAPATPDGYLASEVDELLHRAAAELDADRPAGPLIENATFQLRRGRWAYNIDAVDWFLGQLLVPQDRVEPDETSADLWRDVGEVTQLVLGGVSSLAHRYPPPHKPTPRKAWKWFAEQCENLWRDFGQQPGVQLWWRQVRARPEIWELRTTEQQTLASADYGGFIRTSWAERPKAVSVGGRHLTFQKVDRAKPPSPIIAEIASRTGRDEGGHFAEPARKTRLTSVIELVDEAGIPILYISGTNIDMRAGSCVTFPDRRWLRFLVRGTKAANAIMTAVDQAGNKVARYRISDTYQIDGGLEITVNPDQKLTDELAIALAIPAKRSLRQYFASSGPQ